jgi:hypothetical protein
MDVFGVVYICLGILRSQRHAFILYLFAIISNCPGCVLTVIGNHHKPQVRVPYSNPVPEPVEPVTLIPRVKPVTCGTLDGPTEAADRWNWGERNKWGKTQFSCMGAGRMEVNA